MAIIAKSKVHMGKEKKYENMHTVCKNYLLKASNYYLI